MPRITKDGQPNTDAAKKRRRMAETRDRQRQDREERQKNKAQGIVPANSHVHMSEKNKRANTKRLASVNDPALLSLVEYCLTKAALGFTPRQISMVAEDELGYPVTALRAKRLIEAEMDKRKSPIVAEIRRKSDLTLSLLMTKLETKINDGDVQAIHEARLLDESRRRLFGADMPANVRVTGEIEHKLDPAVQAMIEESKARIQAEQKAVIVRKQIESKEIIDAEVVDEEPDYAAGEYSEFQVDQDQEEVEQI